MSRPTRDHGGGDCAGCGRSLDDTEWAHVDGGELVGADCCADC